MTDPVPAEAITADVASLLSDAMAAYEPQAMASLSSTPRSLLSVLLEASRRSVEAAAPAIRVAERERIRAAIDPAQLRKLADWFDTDDEFKCAMFPETWSQRGHEVQDDLRAWADLLGGQT